MELIWYSLIILAMGALGSLAMILISDHLQHREMQMSSVRKQDMLQYQLDRLTAPQSLSPEKQPPGRSTLDGRHVNRDMAPQKAESMAASKARSL